MATVARNKYSWVPSSLCTQPAGRFPPPASFLLAWDSSLSHLPPEDQNGVTLPSLRPCARPLPGTPTWSDPLPSLLAPLPGAGTPAADWRSSWPPSSKGDFLSNERRGTGMREAQCSGTVSLAGCVLLRPQSMCGFCTKLCRTAVGERSRQKKAVKTHVPNDPLPGSGGRTSQACSLARLPLEPPKSRPALLPAVGLAVAKPSEPSALSESHKRDHSILSSGFPVSTQGCSSRGAPAGR